MEMEIEKIISEGDAEVKLNQKIILPDFNHFSKEEKAQAIKEVTSKLGEKDWIKKVVSAAEDHHSAYLAYHLIEKTATPIDALSLSDLLSKDYVSGFSDRSVKSSLIPQLINFSDRAPQEDKDKILQNLSTSLESLKNLFAAENDSFFDENKDWSCELVRSDIYDVVRAQLLFGNTEAVDQILEKAHDSLSENLIGQLGSLKQQPRAEIKKTYYLTQPGVKYKDYYSHDYTDVEDESLYNDFSDIDSMYHDYDNAYFDEENRKIGLSEKISSGEEVDIKNLQEWGQLHLITIKCSSGDPNYLIKNLNLFDKVDKNQIVDSLVLHGHIDTVVNNISLFPETDMLSLAKVFVKHNQSEHVFIEDIFKNIDKEDLIQNLIDYDQLQSIFSHLDQLPNIDVVKISRDAIKNGKTGHLVLCFNQIPKEHHSEIINLMVDSGYSTVFGAIVNNCIDIDQSIAHKFIHAGRGHFVLSGIDRFLINDPVALINTVIEQYPNDLFHGWEEFLKKHALEMDDFMEKLISSGSCSLIVKHKSFFKNIDYPRVADILLQNKDFGRILTEWDIFKNHLEAKNVIFSMLNSGEYSHLFRVLETETLGVTDKKFIFDELMNTGKEGVILEYIQHFPDVEVDHFLYDMIQKGRVSEVLVNLRKLPTKLHHELVNKILSEKKVEELRHYLDVISGLSLEAILSIEGLVPGDYTSIFERLRDHSLSQEDLKTLLSKHKELFGQGEQNRTLRHMYDQYYYKELEALISAEPDVLGVKLKSLIDITTIGDKISKMLFDDNIQSAKSLIGIAKYVGLDVAEFNNKMDFAQIDSKKETLSVERESYRKTDVNREIAKFYLDEFIRVELFGLKTALRLGIFPEGDHLGRGKLEGLNKQQDLELSRIQDKILYSQLEKEGAAQIEFMISLFREYLVFACTSEMRHQDQLRDPNSDVTINGKFRYKNNSSEEMRLYFSRCKDRFSKDGWLSSFGGQAWANIAQCGVDIWDANLDGTQKIFLIDRIIDIQHNSGRIFDKDSGRMVFRGGSLTHFLDYRKNVSSLDDLLQYCLKEELISQAEVGEYLSKRDSILRLKDFSKTPVRREFSD